MTAPIATPAARLAEAVLEQAARDVQRLGLTRNPSDQRLYRDAWEWIASDERSHEFSFVAICDVLGYSAAAVRARLLAGAPRPNSRRPAPAPAGRSLAAGCAALLLAAVVVATPARVHSVTLTLTDTAIDLDAGANQLTLSIGDGFGVESAELSIIYDPAVVRIASNVTTTALSAGCMLVSNDATPGMLLVSFACVRPLPGDGELLTLLLHGEALGASVLRVLRCDLNEGRMPCRSAPGRVTVRTASSRNASGFRPPQ